MAKDAAFFGDIEDVEEERVEEKEPIDYESLGKLMKRVRKERGLTQDQVVKIPGLNIDRSVYAKYESGKVKASNAPLSRGTIATRNESSIGRFLSGATKNLLGKGD